MLKVFIMLAVAEVRVKVLAKFLIRSTFNTLEMNQI
jgi:hypothetical protein